VNRLPADVSDEEAALAARVVWILLENLTVEQRFLDLDDVEILFQPFSLRVNAQLVLTLSDQPPDLIDVHNRRCTF